MGKRWHMHFNPSKYCYIRLSNKQHLLDFNYNIHNTVLQETNNIKYLGVHIDDKLTWKSHVDTIVTKANSVKVSYHGILNTVHPVSRVK